MLPPLDGSGRIYVKFARIACQQTGDQVKPLTWRASCRAKTAAMNDNAWLDVDFESVAASLDVLSEDAPDR